MWFVVLLASGRLIGQAQSLLTNSTASRPPYSQLERHWALKTTLPIRTSPFPGSLFYQLAVERRLGTHQTIQLNAGYGGKSYDAQQVLLSQAEWRYYKRAYPQLKGGYLAIDVFYKHVLLEKSSSTGGQNCLNQICHPYGPFSVSIPIIRYGSHFKIGHQHLLGTRERFILDWFTGIGWQMILADPVLLPDGNYTNGTNSFFYIRSSTFPRLSLALGLKLGIVF
ncbi:hypothetical protein [Spirosoma gilvum]